ncbi:SDR family oxidoreductase [Massilia sp. W12]|uniref:SDR family NAD(P)-dependent oxidoreductase n=1 Tax=Massilia sp. W12 TaxID=3126507 RepID=UPI0030CE8A23
MTSDFNGKVALIVGGTSGIGLAAAQLFHAAGAQVVISGRDLEKGRHAAHSIGPRARFLACDVTQADQIAAMFALLGAEYGRLDAAVNSAAGPATPGQLHDIPETDARALLDTDVLAPLLCMQHEIALLRRQGGGTIVNLSSVNGLSGCPQAALYSAGRHAVLGLTRSAALEYIAENIRINAVCPGAVDTPRRSQRLAHLAPEQQQAAMARTAQDIPIRRLARAEEIANAIFWLSSPQSSYVVGHALVVDGGLAA